MPGDLLLSYGFSDVTRVGQGAYGAVYKCAAADGSPVAVKVCTEQHARTTAAREAALMTAIPAHKHILPLSNYQELPTCTLMSMPLASGGDTLQYMLDRQGKPMLESEAHNFFVQLVTAVEHLHAAGFVHRDIKCENILLGDEGRRTVLLADFGFATRFNVGDKLTEPWGSLHYSSPEICSHSPYEGPEVDIWSMGVVLYAWVTGRLPFGGNNEAEISARIIQGLFSIPNTVSPRLASLISGMLQVDSAKRFTIADIRKQPWFYLSPLPSSGSAPVMVPRRSVPLVQVPPPPARRSSLAEVSRKPSKLTGALQLIFRRK